MSSLDDKHLAAIVLICFLAVWIWIRDPSIVHFIDMTLGSFLTLLMQKVSNNKEHL